MKVPKTSRPYNPLSQYRSDILDQKVPEPRLVRRPDGTIRGEVSYQRNYTSRLGIQTKMNALLASFNAQDDLKAWMETPAKNLFRTSYTVKIQGPEASVRKAFSQVKALFEDGNFSG